MGHSLPKSINRARQKTTQPKPACNAVEKKEVGYLRTQHALRFTKPEGKYCAILQICGTPPPSPKKTTNKTKQQTKQTKRKEKNVGKPRLVLPQVVRVNERRECNKIYSRQVKLCYQS